MAYGTGRATGLPAAHEVNGFFKGATMKNLLLFLSALLASGILVSCASLNAQVSPTPSEDLVTELKPYLRKAAQAKFASVNKEFPLNIYFIEETTGGEPRAVVIYIKNKAWERVGRESDLSILKDYLQKKYIIVTVDLGDEPKAVSPAVDDDVTMIFRACFGAMGVPNMLRPLNLDAKPGRCFILPEGYRFVEDLTYWEIDKHGVHGTLEYVMKTYNELIVPSPRVRSMGLKPVEKPSDMVGPDGKPLDYRIQMDIIYPSQAKKKCPVFVYSVTGIPRATFHRYQFQLRGYVYVMMGHCFNPIEHYWHVGPFTLDHWNGLACYTAAMRYLYKNADTYAMDTRHIGMMGISKGQYAVTRLSDPNHARGEESKTYSEFPAGFGTFPAGTYGPQPWQGYPSQIHCGWQGMGMGLWEREYITPDYAPTILACGDGDREVITKEGTPLFLGALEKLDVNHVYLPMDNLGHSISVGFDKRLGVDRYKLVNDFFDRYLRPELKLPPALLIVAPRDGADNVSPDSAIWVQFAPVIDAKTIVSGKAVTVTSLADGKPVAGAWKVSHGGTMFTFTPAQPLAKGAQYEVSATKGVKDKTGTALADEKKIVFKVAP